MVAFLEGINVILNFSRQVNNKLTCFSIDVILRAETVESVQPGDRVDFTGTLIVTPDIGALALPGVRAEPPKGHKEGNDADAGIKGLKALGVRELNYKMAFLSCSVEQTKPLVRNVFKFNVTY